LKELQPEVAAWMEAHKRDCGMYCSEAEPCYLGAGIEMTGEGIVYRLRPDYETDRWWFQPSEMSPTGEWGISSNHHTSGRWLEVGSSFARYVQSKPDCDCQLRVPRKGDLYLEAFGEVYEWVTVEFDWSVINPELCYRWCRPKQPESGWREYSVTERNGVYYVKGYNGGDMALHKASCRVGFGGVRFDGQDTWCALVAAYGDCGLHIFSHGHDSKPATPIKARFWEAQAGKDEQ
jgi:hypothetical protein